MDSDTKGSSDAKNGTESYWLLKRSASEVISFPSIGSSNETDAVVVASGISLKTTIIKVPQVYLSIIKNKEKGGNVEYKLVQMSTPVECAVPASTKLFLSQPNDIIPPSQSKSLLTILSLPIHKQMGLDCIDFVNTLLFNHPSGLVCKRSSAIDIKSASSIIMPKSKQKPFEWAIEFLETRTIKTETQVRVCHSAIWLGEGLYLSKLGLMATYPMLTFEELCAVYPTAKCMRLVYLHKGCVFCNNTEKKTKRCTRCWSVQYCDMKCQRLHWDSHAPFCCSPPSLSARANSLFSM